MTDVGGAHAGGASPVCPDTFSDILNGRLDGPSFIDKSVRYTGTADDQALSRSVARLKAHPAAARHLRYDSELTGRILLLTETLHARNDRTAFVRLEDRYLAVVGGGGQRGISSASTTRTRANIRS